MDALTFRRMVARMRAVLPVPRRRVSVDRQELPCLGTDVVYGFTVARKRSYHITIRRSLSRAETTDTLLHEWAHAYSGDFTHGAKWGIAYARAYRAYHGVA